MLLRTRVANGRPAPNAFTKFAEKRWRQHVRSHVYGYRPKILQNLKARRYLRARGGAACCLSNDTILCSRTPSKSTLCEELLHVLQFDSGLHNAVMNQLMNRDVIWVMEYLAARVLVHNEVRWRIPPVERWENRMRLRRYSGTISERLGGLSWRLRLKLRRSIGWLGRELESWMGSYLTEKCSSETRLNWSTMASSIPFG